MERLLTRGTPQAAASLAKARPLVAMLACALASFALVFALAPASAYAADHGQVKTDSNGQPMEWYGNATSLNAGAGATDEGVTLRAAIYEDGCLVIEPTNGATEAQLTSVISLATWRNLLPWSPTSGSGATEYMQAVKSVEIADGVTADNFAYYFFKMTDLVSINRIPDGTTSLKCCFYDCTSLNQVPDIPNSVKDMSSCFYGCTSLTEAPVDLQP